MNLNLLKFSIRATIVLTLAFFVLKSMYVFTVNHAYNEHKDTGTIISKSTEEVAIKHGTSTELYLNIQFDKSGFRSIEVEPTTYFKFKKGNRITFNLKDSTEAGNSLYFFAGLIFYVIGGIILFICLITWAFNIDWDL